MNKLLVFSISMLALFVGFCGWRVLGGAKSGNENLWCPNSMKRIQEPPPYGPEEILKQNKAMYDHAIAEINSKPFLIEGREIVMVNGDPERHDMANYLYRINHKLMCDH